MTRAPVALVTGGNRGIGFETCRRLAGLGHHVVLTSRKLADAERAARELGGKSPVEARTLDVTDPASISALLSHAASWEKLDVLVNNAGVTQRGFSVEIARATLATNFFGALRVTEALLPVLADDARVVMVSSGMGELANFGSELTQRFSSADLTREQLIELTDEFVAAVARGDHAARGWPSNAYRVSKAALNALTRILARELAGTQIKVNAVCPGWVRTRMGGPGATRSPEEAARGILWAATLPASGPSGGCFRDGKPIEW